MNVNLLQTRLQQWKRQSVNRSILVVLLTVGIVTVLVKAITLVKDLLVAPRFGVSSELDAFLVSFIVPSLVINLVSSSFNASLIPAYIDTKQNHGEQAANELLRLVSGRLLLILVACTVVLGAAGPLIISLIGSQFDAATLRLCVVLYFIALPCIVINGMSTIWTAILNAEDRFAAPALSAAIVPMGMIIAMVVAPTGSGVSILTIGMLIGYVLQTIVLGYSLHRNHIPLTPHFVRSDPRIKKVMEQVAPAITGGFLANSTGLVDQTMAAMLGAGSVSILNYGSKLVSFALGIATVAISSAMLPYFSRLVSNRDWKGVRHTYRTYAIMILVVCSVTTLLVIVFSEPIIRLTFQRGAFTADDTKIVSYVQNLSVLQVPFFALSILTVRVLSAMKRNHVLAQAAVLNGVINIVLDYVLMHLFGVAGIALSTTGVYLSVSIFLFVALRHYLKKAEQEQVN